jgi:tape measure domain-containing protein
VSNDLVLNLRIRANADGTAQVLGQTSDGIRRVSTESGNASNALRGMESAASGLMRTIAPLVGIYQLISFGHKVVDDTAAVQDLDTRLHSLTKTAGNYGQTVDYVTAVAEEHHKKINDLSDGYARLRNLQNSGIITGQQTKGMLEGLDNAASALGANNEQLKQTFFGLAQGLASGVLHAEELNQVTEPLPGLMQSLDKAAGVGAGGFRRLTNDGKVTSQMFAETLVKALHDFDGAAASTARNVNAKSTDISNSWTRLVKSVEPTTSALWTPIQDGAKDALDSVRAFNEAAITVGETNVSASSLAQGAWVVTTNEIGAGFDILKAAGLGAAADTASSWVVSGDQMQSNVKFLVNDMIGLFVGLGHATGIIFGALTTNVSNTIDNAIAKASAAAGDVARMGVGDFSFSSSKAVVDKPMVNGFADVVSQLKTDLSTDYVGTFTKAVEGAALANQKLTDEQKKVAESAEQAKAKTLQLAAAHGVSGNASGQSAEAAKKAAAEAKKHAEAIDKEIASLNDQHQKLTLSERAYEQAKLAAMGMEGAVLKSAMAVWDSTKALEKQKKGIDAGDSAMDAEIDRYNKLTQSANEYKYSQLLLAGVSPGNAIEIVAKSSVNDGIEKQQQKINDTRASLENYNKSLADTIAKTTDLGATNSAIFDSSLGGINTLSGAFDNMIKSISANTKALNDLHKAKMANDALERDTNNLTQDQIKKNNGDYLIRLKEIADNKKTYALEEKYLNLENLKDSLTGIRQSASAMGSMFAENTAARKAFNIVSLAASVSERMADIAQLEVKAALAVLTQGQGDPYTAFARIAAMGAIVASILSAANAGTFNFGGNASSPGPQGMSSDTGTVLGDSTAKSQSIDKTYQLLEDIQSQNYPVLKSIDKGIADLHSGITDVITRLFQAGGLTTVKAPSSQITGIHGMLNSIDPIGSMGLDPIGQFLLGGIFGGKQTSTVTAQGISTNATALADILAGKNLSAQQFAQIETKTSGGWFSSDKYSTRTQYAALDSATQKALNDVFKSMGSTMLGLADNLGLGLSDRVKNYIIPALSVDLKGLNGEDAAKKLNGVLSAALDTMSSAVFGDVLGQYQQLGEGMLETAVRVVSEIAVVEDALKKSSITISGDAIAISDSLSQAAGGIKEFQKQFDTYYQKFYTDAERQVFLQKNLTTQLGDLNTVLPESRDGYRILIESLNINNAGDQQRYSLLLKLSDAANTYYTALEAAATAAQQLTTQRRALDIQLIEASGNAIGALTEKRKDELAAMDASLRFSQQSVWAVTSAQTAVSNAVNDVSKAISNLTALAAKLHAAVASTSVQTDALLRQDRIGAANVLKAALATARGGGSIDNYTGLDKALTDLAKPSSQLYSTFLDYARDQMRASGDIAQLADYADKQVDSAQMQIDAINGTTSAVKSVSDAINALAKALQIKDDTLKAVTKAQTATKAEDAAKAIADNAAQVAEKSASALAAQIALANKASQDARSAQDNAGKLSAWAPAPTTWQNGQTNNAVWEQVLSQFNAFHTAKYGIAMNRPWNADGDAQAAYGRLVAQYNSMSAAAANAALASANALAAAAQAARDAIPVYQAAAATDKAVASAANANYSDASSAASSARDSIQYVSSGGAIVNPIADTFYNNATGNTLSLSAKRASVIAAFPPGTFPDMYSWAKKVGLDSRGLDLFMDWTAGTSAGKAAKWKLPAFDIGTNRVTRDMVALIHENERIMPAADNKELMMRLSEPRQSQSDNREIVAELVALRREVENLKAPMADTAKNTGEMASTLRTVTRGGRAMVTEAFS